MQAWLEAHVSPIRTIDATDEDFSDLEALADAIGARRLVQLGEPSHGAGACFAAKARIVKFLHQRHGFDVLIWESGLYDVALAHAGMRGADDAMTAARRGVFTLWSMAAEVKPLFDTIKASQATVRPLEMAAFDMQVTADGSTKVFAQDLRAFVAGLRDQTLRDRATALAEQGLAARATPVRRKVHGPGYLDALTAATRGLGTLIAERRADFEQVRGPLVTAFMARAIENMRADAAFRAEFSHAPATTAAPPPSHGFSPDRSRTQWFSHAVRARFGGTVFRPQVGIRFGRLFEAQ